MGDFSSFAMQPKGAYAPMAREVDMATYQFRWLDRQGHVAKSREIECVADQMAIERAALEIGDYAAIEISEAGRLVCLYVNPNNVGQAP
jgi:hypothetical protein